MLIPWHWSLVPTISGDSPGSMEKGRLVPSGGTVIQHVLCIYPETYRRWGWYHAEHKNCSLNVYLKILSVKRSRYTFSGPSYLGLMRVNWAHWNQGWKPRVRRLLHTLCYVSKLADVRGSTDKTFENSLKNTSCYGDHLWKWNSRLYMHWRHPFAPSYRLNNDETMETQIYVNAQIGQWTTLFCPLLGGGATPVKPDT